MNRNAGKGVILLSVIFIILCITRYHDFLFMLPNGIHEEAQADRLALAMQFYDEGMNFFKPRTYSVYPVDRITAVEFPVHSYMAAASGYIFGREHISTSFRLLTLLITYAGLLALFLSCYRVTKDAVSSLFVPLFLFCSPSFAFYACNYMPDVPAVAISFIGMYFFLIYYENGEHKRLVQAIIFLTLAALIKTTVGIILLTVMGYTVLDMLFIKRLVKKETFRKVILTFTLSLSIIIAYFLYNQYLTAKYQSGIFVLRILPFQNLEEVKLYFTYSIRHTFVNEYFIVPQYPFILMLFACGAVIFIRRPFLWFFAIMFTGTWSATYLFGRQLIHHDYYFVSMWLPAITISLLIFFTETRNTIIFKKGITLFNSAVISSLFILLVFSNDFINSRITLQDHRYPGIRNSLSTNWLQGGSEVLDKIGIGKDSTILVLDEGPANLGLVYFDRKGRALHPDSWRGNIFNVRDYMKDLDIHIMVCNAAKMPEIETTYSQHFNELFRLLYRDERCAVYYLVR